MAIKTGVNFYSYMDKQFLGEFGLEECMRAAKEAGGTGFELLPEETSVGSFPEPSVEEVDRWFALVDEYGLEPLQFTGFVDAPMFRGEPDLPLEDLIAQQERYIRLCALMEVPILRAGLGTHRFGELLEASIPSAEKHDVKLGVCLAFDMTSDARIEELVGLIERADTEHVGFVIDFSMFTTRMSPSFVEQQLRNGADPGAVEYILRGIDEGRTADEIGQGIMLMGGNDKWTRFRTPVTYLPSHFSLSGYTRPENAMATLFGPCGAGVAYRDPEFMKDLADHILLCQGKVYDLGEDGVEPSVDYENPIRVLKEIDWDGYITTCYEGQRNFHDPRSGGSPDEVEVVRRHQVMLKRLIESAEASPL